jgi:threonine dehydrogenase-like Zn-dependent dehydrogenase
MNAITYRGIEDVVFEDVAEPELTDPRDAIVEVTVAGLCGSDLHPYFGRERGIEPGTVMGHEFVGRVVAVGDALDDPDRALPEPASRVGQADQPLVRISVGDRVVAPFTTCCGECFYCRIGLTARCESGQLFGWIEGGEGLHGAQAERVRVPLADATLVHVPDEIEDDAVALLAGDILSTATFGAELARVQVGETVAVIGCGPVGILAIRAALERGASTVVAVDRVPSRLALAEQFGAIPADFEEGDPRAVVDAATNGRGADSAIEAVGSPEATRCAADLLRPGGRLAAVGVHSEPHLALSPGEIYDRNLVYAGGRCPARHYMPRALGIAARDAELLAGLVSHRLPLSEGVEAYRHFGAREPGWTKVVLIP